MILEAMNTRGGEEEKTNKKITKLLKENIILN